MKKVLVIKDASVDWEKYFSDRMRNQSVDVYTPYKNMNPVMDFICHVFMHFNVFGCGIFYNVWKHSIKNYHTVIIFDRIYSQNIIKYIREKDKNVRIIFWYWNLVRKNTEPRYSDIAEYWTFDDGDAEKYKLEKNTQFYFKESIIQKSEYKYDVFFIGSDKGRAAEIKKFEGRLQKAGFRTCFKIVRDQTSDGSIAYAGYIGYDDILSYILQSKCILDFGQKSQNGLTLRVLEATFYHRLLITNNSRIKQYDLYDPHNIAVIPDDEDKIPAFLNNEYRPLQDEIADKYDYSAWLKNFNLIEEE